jgi:hypothetical protein
MPKIRSGKVAHLEFMARLRELLVRHAYTISPEFNRITVFDQEGRKVCSFREMEPTGAKDLKFGAE